MPGLDPGIFTQLEGDARIKSAHDGVGYLTRRFPGDAGQERHEADRQQALLAHGKAVAGVADNVLR